MTGVRCSDNVSASFGHNLAPGPVTDQFLDGIRVVTLAQNVPGPLAAARMREAGARVTKIEPPAGDPFLALSREWHAELHEGIPIERLDLKSPDGLARLTVLLADADLLLTSQRPSAIARLGLDPASLRARGSPALPTHPLAAASQESPAQGSAPMRARRRTALPRSSEPESAESSYTCSRKSRKSPGPGWPGAETAELFQPARGRSTRTLRALPECPTRTPCARRATCARSTS